MTDEPVAGHRPTSNRRVIGAHCTTHRGSIGYANLVIRKVDGTIELDPHVTGTCVIMIDEGGATELRDALTEWLG